MSLSNGASAKDAMSDLAERLVTFLAANAHGVAPAQAAIALKGLPEDPKPAAKELRVRLSALGIELKHTHALKAVAVARGAPGVLGLGTDERWALYSWSPDAPSLSARPAKFTSLREAADELCSRVREAYEGARPSVDLSLSRERFVFYGDSLATGSSWKSLLVRLSADGVPLEISLVQAKQLAERVRRLAEGELHGWVGGISALEYVYAEDAGSEPQDSVKLLSHDGWLLDEAMSAAGVANPLHLPLEMPRLTKWRDQPFLSAEGWQALRKRCIRFYADNDVMPEDWCVEQLARPDFDDVHVDVELVIARCAHFNLSFQQLELRSGTGGAVAHSLSRGQLALRDVPGVARALELETPNDLLPAQVSSAVRIPLPRDEDLALWLSRMSMLDVDSTDAAADGRFADLRRLLMAQCSVPFQTRRAWSSAVPTALQAACAAIASAGLVVSARMEVRFVKDLPIDEWRPTTACVLSLERDVRNLPHGSDVVGGALELVAPEWLERFNEPTYTGVELMRYSDHAQALADKRGDGGDGDNLFAQVMAGQELFGKDHVRINSAQMRMEALSRLMKSHPLEPWVRRSTDGQGMLMVQEAAFEATARCPLVDVDGRPGFAVQSFYLLCATHDHVAA